MRYDRYGPVAAPASGHQGRVRPGGRAVEDGPEAGTRDEGRRAKRPPEEPSPSPQVEGLPGPTIEELKPARAGWSPAGSS